MLPLPILGILSKFKWYLLAGALIVAGFAGYRVGIWQGKAAQLAALEAEIAAKEKLQQELHSLGEELLDAQNNVRIEYRTITREIPKYIDTGSCTVHPDGVRVIREKIEAANARRGGDG